MRVRAEVVRLMAAALLAVGFGAASSPEDALAQPNNKEIAVVGITGLTWEDLDQPTFAVGRSMFDSGVVSNLVTPGEHRRACRDDAWALLATGQRASASPGEENICNDSERNAIKLRIARHGRSIGAQLAELGICVAPVGAGAVLAAVGGDECKGAPGGRLTMVDLGDLPEDLAERRSTLLSFDRRLASILAKHETTILLGMGGGSGGARLRPAVVRDVDPVRGELWSPTTKQQGLVQLTDVTGLLINEFRLTASPQDARVPMIRRTNVAAADLHAEYQSGARRASHALAASPVLLMALWLLIGVAAALTIRRSVAASSAALVASCAVPGLFLVNLIHWWAFTHPTVALWAAWLTGTLSVGVDGTCGARSMAALYTFNCAIQHNLRRPVYRVQLAA